MTFTISLISLFFPSPQNASDHCWLVYFLLVLRDVHLVVVYEDLVKYKIIKSDKRKSK